MKSPRRNVRFAAAILLLSAVAPFAFSACGGRPHRTPFQGKVVGVSDGDTMTVLDGTTRVRVRLNGIDCPEKGQAFGTRAKKLTSELAFGGMVTVRPFGKDRYDRLLGEVVLPDGRVLNEELVAAGMAWHDTRYSKDATLANLEREARRAGLGVWSDARPVAPWEFRAMQKRRAL
jgi:endonuclease YncB( thermonuclease family)